MIDTHSFFEKLQGNAKGKSCLVALTGGIESSSLLYLLKQSGANVAAYFTDCGCPGELNSAQLLCSTLGVPMHTYDMRGLLIGQNTRDAFSFVAIAYGLYVAQHLSADQLYLGFEGEQMRQDVGMGRFVNDIASMYDDFDASAQQIEVVSPYQYFTKPEVIQLAASVGFDMSYTWSCDHNGNEHCGSCQSCTNRKRAFKVAGVSDPTIYLE
jgi:7-cyano-7-deazaguanine synthase in queuosine biosynthesis